MQATEGILNPDEVARRTPLLPKHINKLGRCGFALLEAIVAGQVRFLRALLKGVTPLNELNYLYL